MKKRFTEEQIIAVLRESEAGDVPIKVLCKRHNISEQTFFRWRNKYGEYAYLTPDGMNEQWCLKGDMSRAELPGKGAQGTSHVTVQGALGPRGSYGNLGVCKRILTVTKLVTVTNMRAGS